MNAQVDVLKDNTYRLSPNAADAIEEWQAANPDRVPVHTQKWDVGNPALYHEDRWQPVFAEMRAKAPLNWIEGTPNGDMWNVTTLKNIQHVEALPLVFSSDMHNGGFVISDPHSDDQVETHGRNFLGMHPAPPQHRASVHSGRDGKTVEPCARAHC